MEFLPEGVDKITGPKPGPVLAIFAGVHGNEKVGVLALRQLQNSLELVCGEVFLVYANPQAILQDRRLVNKNLNRCFFEDNEGDSYEDARARELMAVLDRCEALLDLHAFNELTGEPFIICEDNALGIARKLEPQIISTNWSKAEPGATDGYMYAAGKIGICLECGPLNQAEKYKDFAIRSVRQFLQYFGVVDEAVEFSSGLSKRIVRAERSVVRRSEDFYLDPTLASFQQLHEGQIIGLEDGDPYVAQAGEYIIFPRSGAAVGAEAFIIGRLVP